MPSLPVHAAPPFPHFHGDDDDDGDNENDGWARWCVRAEGGPRATTETNRLISRMLGGEGSGTHFSTIFFQARCSSLALVLGWEWDGAAGRGPVVSNFPPDTGDPEVFAHLSPRRLNGCTCVGEQKMGSMEVRGDRDR